MDNPRPPKAWWQYMWKKTVHSYPRNKNESIEHYRAAIDKITAGIWWNYPEKTRAELIRRYDRASRNVLPDDKRLHSSRSHILDVQDVANKEKPAALVDDYAATEALRLGLKVFKVPAGSFGPWLSEKLSNVVVKPGNEENAKRILDILRRYPISEGRARPANYHRELGRALGYSEEDIEYFLRQFPRKEKNNLRLNVLPCPSCQTMNTVARAGVYLKCQKCGKNLVAVKVKKH